MPEPQCVEDAFLWLIVPEELFIHTLKELHFKVGLGSDANCIYIAPA